MSNSEIKLQRTPLGNADSCFQEKISILVSYCLIYNLEPDIDYSLMDTNDMIIKLKKRGTNASVQ